MGGVPDAAYADVHDGLRSLTTALRRARQRWLETHRQLPPSLLGLLTELDRASRGSGCGGCRLTDLAAGAALDPSTVSREIAQLIELGLVVRQADPRDRRVSRLALTPAGADVLATGRSAAVALIATALRDWPQDDATAFATALRRFAGDLTDHLSIERPMEVAR